MFSKSRRIDAPFKSRPVKKRPVMSLMEKDMVVVKGDLVWDKKNWVKMWGDTGNTVQTGRYDATAQAEVARAERARVREQWPLVKQIAQELLTGQRTFNVTRDDAQRSALCNAGIDAFVDRIWMPNQHAISGRMAASLMVIEPQLGFVIFAAYERTRAAELVAPLQAIPAE